MYNEPLKFKIGENVRWITSGDGIAFEGLSAGRTVQFIVTAEALAYMMPPDRGDIDAQTCARVFAKHELDMHLVAQRKFSGYHGPEPVVLGPENMLALI